VRQPFHLGFREERQVRHRAADVIGQCGDQGSRDGRSSVRPSHDPERRHCSPHRSGCLPCFRSC
jgi:hypothetical protein